MVWTQHRTTDTTGDGFIIELRRNQDIQTVLQKLRVNLEVWTGSAEQRKQGIRRWMCGHTPNSIIGNNGTAVKADEVWEGADPQPEKDSNTNMEGVGR